MADTTTTTPIELPVLPENWHSALSDDLKTEESLKLFKDIPSLAKSLVHAQKQFGADKIALPTKYTTEQEWTALYQKLGVPQDVKDYSVEVPKDLGFEGERLQEFKVAALKAGIAPKQLQALMQFHADDTKKVLNATQTKIQQDIEAAKAELKQEWGVAHDKKLAQAKGVVQTLNDPKFSKWLEDTHLGDHPNMVRIFAKLGEILGEKQVQGNGDEVGKFGSVKTPDVAKRELAMIQGNMAHPYNDARHPGHHLAVEEMQQLFSQAFPHVEA